MAKLKSTRTKEKLGVINPRPRNPRQAQFLDVADDTPIVFLLGPAGTGKTFAMTAWALRAMQIGLLDLAAVTRPMEECGGEEMGFMPGEMSEKYAPWIQPFGDVLNDMVGRQNSQAVLKMFEPWPLAYIRGRTIGDRVVGLLDEAQNASVNQLHAYTTRIGTGGHLFISGDPEQGDLPGGGWHLETVARELEREGVAKVIRFLEEDIVRHKFIAGINRAFARIKGKKPA